MKLKHAIIGFAALTMGGLNADATALIEYRFNGVSYPDAQTFYDSSGNERNVLLAWPSGMSSDNPFASTIPLPNNISGFFGAPNSEWRSGTVQNIGSTLGITDAFTLQGWLKPTAYDIGADVFVIYSSNEPSRIQMGFSESGIAYGYLTNDYGENKGISASSELTLGEWAHLALTYDGETLSFYLNAELVGSQEISVFDLGGLDRVSIFGGGRGYAGGFDDFGVYDVALTREQLGYFRPFDPIPEANTAALLAVGLLGGLLARKRVLSTK